MAAFVPHWKERCKLYLDRLQCRAPGFVGSLVNRGLRSPEPVLGLGVLNCCYFEFECLESLLKGLPVHDAILAFAGGPCHLPLWLEASLRHAGRAFVRSSRPPQNARDRSYSELATVPRLDALNVQGLRNRVATRTSTFQR